MLDHLQIYLLLDCDPHINNLVSYLFYGNDQCVGLLVFHIKHTKVRHLRRLYLHKLDETHVFY